MGLVFNQNVEIKNKIFGASAKQVGILVRIERDNKKLTFIKK
jgi:hypothetical protein